MLGDLRSGSRDAVIVYNLDRLHRLPAELEDFVTLRESVGCHQVATVTADIDLGNDDGSFMARIFAAFAANESGHKSARQKRKNQQRAAHGLPHGPARAFGYDDDKVTLRADEAALVRELVARVIAAESVHGLTVWLNDTGVPTVRGGRWSTTAVRGIVSSPRVASLRAYRGEVIGTAISEPIITPAARDPVLAALAARSWSRRRAVRTRLLSQARHTDPDRCVRRYVCSSGPNHGGCGRLTVVAQPVEDLLADAVLARLDSPALADPITTRIRNTERQLATLTGTAALHGLAGHGTKLRTQWADLTLDRQHAIIKAVLDHAVVTAGTPGARSLDIDRVGRVHRSELAGENFLYWDRGQRAVRRRIRRTQRGSFRSCPSGAQHGGRTPSG